MVGTFKATTLDLDAGYTYWEIDDASVVFNRDCFGDDTTVTAFYYDLDTGAEVSLDATATASGAYYYFNATITSSLKTNGYIGFNITSNVGCEGSIEVMEFILKGTQIATPSPTTEPSAAPTPEPTTSAPTSSAPSTSTPTTSTPTPEPTTS